MTLKNSNQKFQLFLSNFARDITYTFVSLYQEEFFYARNTKKISLFQILKNVEVNKGSKKFLKILILVFQNLNFKMNVPI